MNERQARQRLAILWFAGSAVPLLLVIAQSVIGHFGNETKGAWSWLLPCLVPTLSLIVGVLVAEAHPSRKGKNRTVDRFTYRVAFGLSAFHLTTVLATLLLQPIAVPAGSAMEFLDTSMLWIAPVQGLAIASLGAFFVSSA